MNWSDVLKMFPVLEPNDEGEVVLRTGKARDVLPPFDYQGFQYKAYSVQSFADLVKAKTTNVNSCVVFVNDIGFHAILDDEIYDRKQDTVTYGFTYSVIFEEWKEILINGKVFDIKSLSDFIKRREENEIDDVDDLLYAVQNFRYVTNVEGDFTFADRNNYTFNIKVNEAEGTVRIPKTLVVSLEILKDSGFVQDVEVEIEVHRPKDQTEKPGFLLSCPKFGRYLERAKQNEIDRLPALLPEYLIAAGSC